MKILVVAGGWSPEQEVSRKGAQIIAQTLEGRGHEVILYELSKGFEELAKWAKEVDVAFINLHGSPGEDGLVQAFLERFNCPYQGSRPAPSFLALHKYAAKVLFENSGLKVAKGFFLSDIPAEKELDALLEKMNYPLFVKSNNAGSSIHLYRVKNRAELLTALESIIDSKQEALVEELIEGQEITCGVLGDIALPPVMIVPKGEFFDYDNKYAANGSEGADEICPAPISKELTEKIQSLALKAHQSLGLSDYSRSDFIVDKNENCYILESNTLPGMTANSLVPKEAKAIGLEFYQLLESLLQMAMAKKV